MVGSIDNADQNFVAMFQHPKLLEVFELFQRRARQPGQVQQKIAAIGVQADVLIEMRRVGGKQIVAPIAGVRNRARLKYRAR